MLSAALGHEIVAVLAVIGAFFVGLAIGGWLFARRIHESLNPGRWYAALETIIGLWALALIFLVPEFNARVPQWIGPAPTALWHWTITFGASLVLLLPATAAMGATLPAAERLLTAISSPGRWVAALYASNTAGAVAGTVVTVFVLAPTFGFRGVLLLCAAVNLCCAILIWQYQPSAHPPTPKLPRQGLRPIVAMLFATGLLGISYEVLAIRILSQTLEGTVYTFALLLSVYLLGTAGGAALYHRNIRNDAPQRSDALLLSCTAMATLLGGLALWQADHIYAWLLGQLGHSTVRAMSADVLIAILVFGPATACMGALFSQLAQRAIGQVGLGNATAANTLGAASAPVLTGIVLLPGIGAKNTLLLIACGYLCLLLASAWFERRGSSQRPTRLEWIPLAVVPLSLCMALTMLPPLRHVSIPAGGSLIDYREGVMASVAVVEDSTGTRHMKVNNHFAMGSTSSGFADHRQTHLPLLLHDQPRQALFLGVGTGMSLDAARLHPNLNVTAVELLPEALATLHHFGTEPDSDRWSIPPTLLAADARRYVLAADSAFDVIVADLFHPSRDGAGALYTVEHFEAIKARLNQDGLFCQWLPLFQMDLESLRLIVRTFNSVFEGVQLHVPHFSLRQPIVGLIGSRSPVQFRQGRLQSRVQDSALQRALVALRLNSNFALYGGYLAGRPALQTFAGPGPLNTDDRPLVMYRAPQFAYQRESNHGERLVALNRALAPQRGSLLQPSNSTAELRFNNRVEDYWLARDHYLQAGLDVSSNADLATLVTQTKDPLLRIVQTSEDFMPAYLPLLAMAESLLQDDANAAAELLLQLDAAAPGRLEARNLLRLLYKGEAAGGT